MRKGSQSEPVFMKPAIFISASMLVGLLFAFQEWVSFVTWDITRGRPSFSNHGVTSSGVGHLVLDACGDFFAGKFSLRALLELVFFLPLASSSALHSRCCLFYVSESSTESSGAVLLAKAVESMFMLSC